MRDVGKCRTRLYEEHRRSAWPDDLRRDRSWQAGRLGGKSLRSETIRRWKSSLCAPDDEEGHSSGTLVRRHFDSASISGHAVSSPDSQPPTNSVALKRVLRWSRFGMSVAHETSVNRVNLTDVESNH